ncbi:hypothetical protein PAXRUDRAFT_12427 [Paxillus rubicundulus Ve08.2h10]|uniref:Uncharacterized protein n=1 Tax=Paxillus rubicundulus Ve08.2h10 TaxID=930991 RepID=A0A0D0DVX5_9AGAM|nr:hypothetical protein PAXRUDRAFT_12427 [Paxillus rubicundulus Ve08.2h10]
MGTEGLLDIDLAAREGLQQLGYNQATTKTRGLFHTLFTIMAVPYGLAAPIATSPVGGGPVVKFGGSVVTDHLFHIALTLLSISRDMFRLSNIGRRVLLMLSPSTSVLQAIIFLDQRVTRGGRKLDHHIERYIRYLISSCWNL